MLVRRLIRESAVRAALFFVFLEGNLVLSILFYPDFRENIPVWQNIAPVQTVKELLNLIAEVGFRAYFVAQHFFKSANTLGTAAAALFAMGAVAREVENRTIEFLVSRPISRRRILASKFAVGAAAITVPVFLSSASAIPLAAALPGVGESLPLLPVLLAAAHCSLFLLAIYAAAFLFSTLVSDQGRVAFVVLGLATLSFALYLVNGATRYSIYRLSDVPTYLRIFDRGSLPLGTDLPLAAATAALFFLAERVFARRDF